MIIHEQTNVGPAPFNEDIEKEEEIQSETVAPPTVLQDGCYATQSFVQNDSTVDINVLPLRHLLLTPSFYVAAALASSLTKLLVRLEDSASLSEESMKTLKLNCLLIITEYLSEYETKIDSLNRSRIEFCINCLLNPSLTTIYRTKIAVMTLEGTFLFFSLTYQQFLKK